MANLCSLNMLNKSGQIVLFLEIFNFKTCQSDSPHILCESHPFCQKGLGWPCQVGQPSKGHPCRILILFSIMFYYIISTTYQKIGVLFCPVHIFGVSHSVQSKGSSQLYLVFCFDFMIKWQEINALLTH